MDEKYTKRIKVVVLLQKLSATEDQKRRPSGIKKEDGRHDVTEGRSVGPLCNITKEKPDSVSTILCISEDPFEYWKRNVKGNISQNDGCQTTIRAIFKKGNLFFLLVSF